jgi:hypothetical protein
MAYLPHRIQLPFLSGEKDFRELIISDFSFRFLWHLTRESTTDKFLIFSLIYLLSGLICLANFYFTNYKILLFNVALTLVNTVAVFFYVIKLIISSRTVSIAEVDRFIKEKEWLKE